MVPPCFSIRRNDVCARSLITEAIRKRTSGADCPREQPARSPLGSEEKSDGRFPAQASSHGLRSLSVNPPHGFVNACHWNI